MSVDAVMARVSELHALLSPSLVGAAAAPAPAAASTATSAGTSGGATAFASQLATAQQAGAVSNAGAAGGSTKYDAEIQAAAARHGLDPALLKGLIRQESNFNPNAGSPAGAQGLTQLMPATAAGLGVSDVHDPAQAIEGGAKYLAQQLETFGGDVTRALAAYNAGPGAVQRHGGVPPYAETQHYVKAVQGFAAEYRGSFGTAPSPSVTPAASSSVASSPLLYGTT